MVDINLLRDTSDPEAEEKEPDRFHPPKLSDLTVKPNRGPSPTAKNPPPTFGQALRSFFGIKPRTPSKPRILTKRAAPQAEKRPTATVPFRPSAPMGAPPTNIPPIREEFTVQPETVRGYEPTRGAPAPITGERAVEDLLAEPVVLGAPAPVKRTPPPPPTRYTATGPVPVPNEPAPTPKPEGLLEEIFRTNPEPPEGGSVPVPPAPPKPPVPPVTAPAPRPPELPKSPAGTTFEALAIGDTPQAKSVVKRNAPGGRMVPKRAETFWARVLRIATGFLPKRNEALPTGEAAEDLDVNLVPEEFSAKLNLGDKSISLALVTLVVAAVIGLAYTGIRIYETRIVVKRQAVTDAIESIRTRTVQLQAQQREAIAFKQRADAVAFALGNHVRWTQFFDSLQRYTEKDVYFVNFAGDLSGALTLTAFGSSYDSVARQYTTFEAADDFIQSVSIAGAQQEESGTVTFTASIQLVPTFYLAPVTE